MGDLGNTFTAFTGLHHPHAQVLIIELSSASDLVIPPPARASPYLMPSSVCLSSIFLQML